MGQIRRSWEFFRRMQMMRIEPSTMSGGGGESIAIGKEVSITGEVYVVDASNRRIQVFDLNGNFRRKWGSYGSDDGQFDFPAGIDVYNNEIYVVDTNNYRIQVFDLNGNFKRKWGSYGTGDGQFISPYGIDVYNSEVYVTDAYNNRIQVFDLNGNFKRKWGSYGTGDGQFNYPVDIVVVGI
jgi:tripartite motif-containing protein 71